MHTDSKESGDCDHDSGSIAGRNIDSNLVAYSKQPAPVFEPCPFLPLVRLWLDDGLWHLKRSKVRFINDKTGLKVPYKRSGYDEWG
jgi:hypothetical protein